MPFQRADACGCQLRAARPVQNLPDRGFLQECPPCFDILDKERGSQVVTLAADSPHQLTRQVGVIS